MEKANLRVMKIKVMTQTIRFEIKMTRNTSAHLLHTAMAAPRSVQLSMEKIYQLKVKRKSTN